MIIGLAVLTGCQQATSPDSDEWEVEEIPIGYRGPARVNPYLAAERFLSGNGYEAKSSLVWSEAEEEMDIIMMPASFLSTKGMGMRALTWVENGGMLVITVEGGEGEINDFRNRSMFFRSSELNLQGFDYLLEECGIEVLREDWETESLPDGEGHLRRAWSPAFVELSIDGEDLEYQVEFEGNAALKADYGTNWELARNDRTRMITSEYGFGDIMILAHARAFRNAYIDRADHAEFVKLIADWRGQKSIVFLYGSGTSFTGLLWQHGWQAIVAGLLLLLFWLWMRIPRFGPLKEDDFVALGGYGEALSASARFLWRKKQLHHYLRPLRDRIEAENPDNPESHYQLLADKSGLSREEVVEAMTAPQTKDPASLTRIVHRLQTILKS